tara:strand:+ start:3117 stop:3314 length:198 start_codon:yes stop_codon:yes gene_type:complete
MKNTPRICIIGQGYVGLPLAVEFGKHYPTIGFDTLEVLEAAGTKWNFLPFRPGLVGGHCTTLESY